MTRAEYLIKLLQFGIPTHAKKKNEQTATPSKYPQGYFKAKKCKRCKTSFIPKSPSEMYCSDVCKDYGIVNAYYTRTYNLTIEQYLDMAEEQNFSCALCGRENFAMREQHSGTLVVDHNHATGEVRGLLCHNCNRALGLLKDDTKVLKTAISYLERVTTIPKGSTL